MSITITSPVQGNFAKTSTAPWSKASALLPVGAVVSKISSIPALLALESDWKQLEAVAGHVTVFQTFDWIKSWCLANIAPNSDSQILVLAGYQFNRLVFAWPLMTTRRHGLTTAEWLTSPSGQYGTALLARDHCPIQWHQAGLAMLRNVGEVDMLHLRHVRQGSSFDVFAEQHMIGAKTPERAPYMDLTQYKTAADYEARYTSTQRKRRKKIKKELEAMGAVEFRQLAPGAETDRAIDMAIEHKITWLTERGRVNRVLHCPAHRQFLKQMARNQTGATQTIVTEITAGGRAVSWEIGFRHAGTHFAYITSHDVALTNLSPGRLHMHHSQLKCIEDGMTRFDLMIPHDAHKESWATGMIATNDYYLPLSLRGALQGHVYVRLVRPALRKAYYAMPQKLLSLLQPLTARVAQAAH